MTSRVTHSTLPLPTGFAWGVVFWVLFSCVAVVLRGVRWEETYENALVISRLVPYPEGHPIFLFFRNLFSAQAYLSAALVRLFPEPLPINGARNVAYLAFTTVPVFVLATVLARGALAGYAAVALVLLGAYLNLDSYYPLNTWPTFYSNGHIGRGWALLALGLLVARRWRAAYLMTGLLACVHLGHLPVLLLVALACVAWLWRQGDHGAARQAALCGGAGLAVSALLWLGHALLFKVEPPVTGPYAVAGDGLAILRDYLPLHDVHRGFPRFGPFAHSVLATVAVLLLCGAAISGSAERRRRYGWLALYGAAVAMVVFGTKGLHAALGDELPYAFLRWMPYRLTNHLAVLLTPVACALLWRPGTRWVLAGILACAAALPLLHWGLPEALYARYAAPEEWLSYVLAGGAWAAVTGRYGRRWGYWAVTLLAVGVLGTDTRYGAVCVAVAWGGGLAFQALTRLGCESGEVDGKHEHDVVPARTVFVVALLVGMLLATMLWQQWRTREHLPRTAIQREVKAYLDQAGERDAMLLTPVSYTHLRAHET